MEGERGKRARERVKEGGMGKRKGGRETNE
jgi:hypothetical protein